MPHVIPSSLVNHQGVANQVPGVALATWGTSLALPLLIKHYTSAGHLPLTINRYYKNHSFMKVYVESAWVTMTFCLKMVEIHFSLRHLSLICLSLFVFFLLLQCVSFASCKSQQHSVNLIVSNHIVFTQVHIFQTSMLHQVLCIFQKKCMFKNHTLPCYCKCNSKQSKPLQQIPVASHTAVIWLTVEPIFELTWTDCSQDLTMGQDHWMSGFISCGIAPPVDQWLHNRWELYCWAHCIQTYCCT